MKKEYRRFDNVIMDMDNEINNFDNIKDLNFMDLDENDYYDEDEFYDEDEYSERSEYLEEKRYSKERESAPLKKRTSAEKKETPTEKKITVRKKEAPAEKKISVRKKEAPTGKKISVKEKELSVKKKEMPAGKKTSSKKEYALEKRKSTSGKKTKAAAKNSRDRRNNGKESRLWYKIKHMDTIDRIVASTGALIMVFAIVTCTMYADAKASDMQVASFQEIGAGMEGIEVIGESGLLAVADAQAAKVAVQEEMTEAVTEYEEKELETTEAVKVEMHLSSMQKDLKIKFVNSATGKLVASVPFEVNITDGGGKTYTLKDEDKDGIIYRTDMAAGKCSVAMASISGAEDYTFSTESVSVTIKDKIEYKKVDVSDEVKKESDVNVAAEDTKKQETAVESVLTDTVAWVESTKTALNGSGTEAGYEEVSKDKITDPNTLVKASGFIRFAAATTDQTAAGTTVPTTDTTASGTATTPTDTGTPPTDTTPPPVVTEIKVSLDKTSLSLKTGETAVLTATTDPAGNAVEWNSSNAGIVSVAGGTIAAVSAGTADITAKTSTGHIATCTVTVIEPEKVKPSITISAATGKVLTEKTFKLTAEVKNASDVSITWSSSNSAAATVSGDGTVTGVSAGTTTIKAMSNADNSIAATCEVTVKTNPEKDSSTKLKDNSGNQLYVKETDSKFREAVYSDYFKADKFYKLSSATAEYKYTGWQTIDGKTYYFNADGSKVTGEQIIKGAKYNFGSDGALSSSSGNMGIDVSKWNGNIDWNAVKNSGVSYVIIRCGYRGSSTGALIEDPKFRSNIQGASAAGLKVGVYFFTQAVNEVEAVEEASMVASLVSGYKISYPVFLDVEPSGGRADNIGKDARTAVCKAFCQTIQNSGYTAGIYANKTWLTSYINTASLTSYKIWLAQYAAAPSYSATKYDLWQYSSKGSVSGISGSVDLNISYLGY
ncbi:putative cell wall binding repeat protein [Kineothrix alysoides]|uniref:Putative cell wall binding repeat protein n=1 Tax=Kineothrix alysoides TaxID=1469948 RepID=A0A4R1R1S7_9FIRM|nr:GH25 family lysozyme [Kineothrix alysoides]TCL59303.1 putative cell wall binding repeat protein [Kineothrix alysoides]